MRNMLIAIGVFAVLCSIIGYRWSITRQESQQIVNNTIPLPKDSDWVKYQPECDNLKNTIVLYYPQGWQYKEFPHVTDRVHAGTKYECQVLIGYGGRPESYQSPTPGVKTIIRVSTWVDTESLEDYTNTLLRQSYSYVENPSQEKMNNTTFTKMVIKDAGGLIYVTKKNDRFFAIQLPSRKTETAGIDIGKHIDEVNKEFLLRLMLL